jgi:hypothetical protein
MEQSIWTSTILNDYFNFPNKGHVCCIQRHIFDYKKKSCRCETVYGITALTPTQANPERLLKLNRGHWRIIVLIMFGMSLFMFGMSLLLRSIPKLGPVQGRKKWHADVILP